MLLGSGELAVGYQKHSGPRWFALRLWPEPALVSWELGPGWMWAQPPRRGRQLGDSRAQGVEPSVSWLWIGLGVHGEVSEKASLSTELGGLAAGGAARLGALRPGIGPWLSL